MRTHVYMLTHFLPGNNMRGQCRWYMRSSKSDLGMRRKVPYFSRWLTGCSYNLHQIRIDARASVIKYSLERVNCVCLTTFSGKLFHISTTRLLKVFALKLF